MDYQFSNNSMKANITHLAVRNYLICDTEEWYHWLHTYLSFYIPSLTQQDCSGCTVNFSLSHAFALFSHTLMLAIVVAVVVMVIYYKEICSNDSRPLKTHVQYFKLTDCWYITDRLISMCCTLHDFTKGSLRRRKLTQHHKSSNTSSLGG